MKFSGRKGSYDDIKSQTIAGLYSLSREYSFEKTAWVRQSQIEPPAFLRLRLLRDQKANSTINHNPCLHCLQHSPKKWDFVFIIRIITFSDSIFKENVSN